MNKLKIFIATLLIALTSSCSTDSIENAGNVSQNENQTNRPDPIDPDPIDPIRGELPTAIYTLKINPNDGNGIGLLRNGVDVPLEVPANYTQISNSVYVNGNDVYVVGSLTITYPNETGSTIATVWKNGNIFMQLGNPNSYGKYSSKATSMTIHNGDIYVVGSEYVTYFNAVLWKNGVQTTLPSNGNAHCNAYAIAVNNSNVCILGKKSNASVLWVNGALSLLPTITYANDLAILGDNLHICGTELLSTGKLRAKKLTRSLLSGTTTGNYLGNGLLDSYASSITIDESNGLVYISGAEKKSDLNDDTRAILWTNNLRSVLSEIGNAGPLKTFNGNLFVTGIQNNYSYGQNTLWVNGDVNTSYGFTTGVRSIALQ